MSSLFLLILIFNSKHKLHYLPMHGYQLPVSPIPPSFNCSTFHKFTTYTKSIRSYAIAPSYVSVQQYQSIWRVVQGGGWGRHVTVLNDCHGRTRAPSTRLKNAGRTALQCQPGLILRRYLLLHSVYGCNFEGL